MSFTFIHTADWQLGRPFKAFDERIAGLLDAARFEAIDRIAAIARGRNAEHVLVAGDVFDAPGLEAKILRKALERLRKHEAVRWHLLPGNHDHVRPGGLWARLAEIGLPGNVAVHDTAKPSEIAPAVTLLPAPLGARAMSADPTAWMDSCATPAGHLRIGLAHGSIRDFGTAEQSAVRIDPARARRAGLAYLALGDWHGKLRIDDRTWYSGTPEPDRFPDNEPGHVLVVRLAGADTAPSVEAVPSARFTWAREAASLARLEDVEGIESRLAARGVDFDRLVVRLVLSGALPLADHPRLQSWRDRLAARVTVLEWEVEALGVRAEAGDLAQFAGSGEVLRAAEALQAIAGDPADPRQQIASRALARLGVLYAPLGEAAA